MDGVNLEAYSCKKGGILYSSISKCFFLRYLASMTVHRFKKISL